MSLMTVMQALGRIETTHPDSPVAVFAAPGTGQVDVMFARTVKTQERIREADPCLIGVFDRTSPLVDVELALRRATNPGFVPKERRPMAETRPRNGTAKRTRVIQGGRS